VAAVAVLLVVTAVGLQAHGTFARGQNQAIAGVSGAVLAIALSAAEGIAVIAFIVVLASTRLQRPPQAQSDDEDELERLYIPWWAKTLGVLLAVAALVTPFAVLFTRKPRMIGPRPLPGGPAGGGLIRPAVPPSSSAWPLITGMVIAILVVLILAVLSRRRRPAPRTPHAGRRRLAALLDSLAAGSEALTAGGEPRAAIIACYAAMERGFAAAGSAPAVADTPAEVLARATRAGLVRAEPAETLTGLFRRARYSTQPMTSTDSRVAADALTELRTDLASQEADQGSAP
jgi:antitoxin (DNA-binding transcriptional repressor) of toxin-antitoxin stability system